MRSQFDAFIFFLSEDDMRAMEIVAEARNLIREKFGISTATIQVIFLQIILFLPFPFISTFDNFFLQISYFYFVLFR